MNHARRTGMMAALSTYLIWGILPLYWNLLARAEANEILAHRIVWSGHCAHRDEALAEL